MISDEDLPAWRRRKHPLARRDAKPRFRHPLVQWLRVRRLSLEKTQREISDKIGVNKSAVNEWENGAAIPTMLNLVDWAQALGCEVVFRRKATSSRSD